MALNEVNINSLSSATLEGTDEVVLAKASSPYVATLDELKTFNNDGVLLANRDIATWVNGAYATGIRVIHLGKIWEANASISSGETPGTSTKWIEVLTGYRKPLYNVTTEVPLSPGNYYTASTARAAVPVALRDIGLNITYAISSTKWVIEQFRGTSVSSWSTVSNWTRTAYDTLDFLVSDSELSGYYHGSIVSFGKVDYVDDGTPLYIMYMRATNPLIQVTTSDGSFIAQYYPALGGGYTATGIQEIELKNSDSVYFKAIVNWSAMNPSIEDYTTKLHINTKVNYTNDLRDLFNDIDAQVMKKSDVFVQTENLFDITDPEIALEKWIPSDSTTGDLEDIGIGGVLTGFIPVSEGDKVNTSLFNQPSTYFSGWYAMFDENKDIITQASVIEPDISDGYVYTVKAGEHFVRIAFRASVVPDLTTAEDLMITLNERITDTYIPYGYTNVFDIKKNVLPNTRTGKTIVCFGDSITEDSFYPKEVGELTGATVINVGVGGCRMAEHQISPNDYDAFSMYNLADAIVSNDWSRQVTAADDIFTNTGDDNRAIVDRMVAIDFDEVDIITIFFGTNDFTGNVPIGVNADATGATLKGAMNYTIETILTEYPQMTLFFITPMYRNVSGVSSDTATNGNAAKLIDFVNAEEEICRLNHIDYLHMYNSAGINPLTIDYYLPDGTHPGIAGGNLISRKIAGFINTH